MKPKLVAPIRTSKPGDHLNEYREDHPAYATIAATRVGHSGRQGGAALFNSDFRHQNTVIVTVRKADISRSTISTEHVMGMDELLEVELSEAQWATFVATPNVGTGVPCTLRSVGRRALGRALEVADEYGYIPGIIPTETRQEQFRGELAARLKDAVEALETLRDMAPNKKVREQAELALRRITDGAPWVAQMFDDHMEETVEKAKIDVAAYMTAAINRAGLTALGAKPPLELEEGAAE